MCPSFFLKIERRYLMEIALWSTIHDIASLDLWQQPRENLMAFKAAHFWLLYSFIATGMVKTFIVQKKVYGQLGLPAEKAFGLPQIFKIVNHWESALLVSSRLAMQKICCSRYKLNLLSALKWISNVQLLPNHQVEIITNRLQVQLIGVFWVW